MRSYKNLSDHDFELLVADLVGAESGGQFEVFARGADGGVDVRQTADDSRVDVVQCKHMEGSTFSQLRTAARKEAGKLDLLDPQPTRYRFFTTRSVTAANKAELRGILAPWIRNDHDIVGAEDLELLLNSRPEVERRHVKLWLSSAAQLSQVMHAEIWSRSEQMVAEIVDSIPRYVDTGVFAIASHRLHEEKVLILSGPPGIGKTSVAQMLVAEAVALGFEPVEISADIEEGNRVLDSARRQVLLYDDFLGATFLQTRLSKNEDKRIASFIARCRQSSNTLLILTTREYILKQATSWSEVLHRSGLPMQRMLLELSSYSRRERGLILYNHLYMASHLSASAKRSLLRDRAYLKIIDHKNYNPRLIEFVTSGYPSIAPPQNYREFVLGNLDEPEQVWRNAFEEQLDDDSRDVVLLLSTMPFAITVSELDRSFASLAAQRGKPVQHGAVRRALKILDDSLTQSWSGRTEPEVAIANPSVADFAGAWLRRNPFDAAAIISSAVFFEQLDWIRAQVVAPKVGVGDRRYEEGFRASIIRTLGSGPLEFSQNRISNRWYVAYRQGRGIEGRLVFALMADNDFPRFAPNIPFDGWVQQTADTITTAWRAGAVGDLENALALLESMHDRGTLSAAMKSAAPDAIATASTADEWEAVATFFEDNSETLEIGIHDVAQHLDAWIDHELANNLDSFSDTDALNALEAAAERFGLSTEGSLWRDAHDLIAARTDGWDSSPLRPQDHTAASIGDASNEDLELIFGRFYDPDLED